MRDRDDPADRAEAYLDGELPLEEALAFERELVERPGASRALVAALALRELLRALPPLAPPPGLEERIAASLPARMGAPLPQGSPGAIRRALAGAAWAVRGPAGALGGAVPAAAGLANVRWALGPLAREAARPPARPPRPLWKRALGVAR